MNSDSDPKAEDGGDGEKTAQRFILYFFPTLFKLSFYSEIATPAATEVVDQIPPSSVATPLPSEPTTPIVTSSAPVFPQPPPSTQAASVPSSPFPPSYQMSPFEKVYINFPYCSTALVRMRTNFSLPIQNLAIFLILIRRARILVRF